ncbi:hypothetical protein ACHAQE_011203 [Botrytis cinerea]|uniref:Aminoglycoside phosphotransferase domain-containing protein n=1 Tax=Botryotinia fuckeliana (strain BcDW1) TaxID=1290391 RepID=M7TQ21_BOTF1|nr:hypothetical protein BcDW1_7934 [Botrytis cinerea BcDW1]
MAQSLDLTSSTEPHTLNLDEYKTLPGPTIFRPDDPWGRIPKKAHFLLCANCGLNAFSEMHCSYISHLRCNTSFNRGFWSIGEKYILKEKPLLGEGRADYVGSDYPINQFLSKNSTIPVAKNMIYWKDSTSYFWFMEKTPGKTLYEVWGELDEEKMKSLAKEVIEYLAQARKFTSTKPENPDGSLIRDNLLNPSGVTFVSEDAEEWWARNEPRLDQYTKSRWKNMNVIENYPVKGPYVLTHGDLDGSNILVKDGHISGIIDWEYGGYLPEWWELSCVKSVGPGTWHEYLQAEMKIQFSSPDQAKAEEFFRDLSFECNLPRVQLEQRQMIEPTIMQCLNYRRYCRALEKKDGSGWSAFDTRVIEEDHVLETFKALSLEEQKKLLWKEAS